MILEAYMPVYIGVKIFIAYGCTGGRAGPPEVVQEALADLKSCPNCFKGEGVIWVMSKRNGVFFLGFLP